MIRGQCIITRRLCRFYIHFYSFLPKMQIKAQRTTSSAKCRSGGLVFQELFTAPFIICSSCGLPTGILAAAAVIDISAVVHIAAIIHISAVVCICAVIGYDGVVRIHTGSIRSGCF